MSSPTDLLHAWERQQTAFIQFRDFRTLCLLETISQSCGGDDADVTVLDVGCGPGSLTNAVLGRFPRAHVIAVDRDPVLLRLLRESSPFLDRITIIDADLRAPDWAQGLPAPCDAAISATALHWLEPEELVSTYRAIAGALRPGGVMMNADHLFFDPTATPHLRQLAMDQRESFRAAAVAGGAHTWESWWDTALTMPGWEAEIELFHQRWADKSLTTKVDADFHLAAMRAAGFTETATIWQWLDDRIVFGRLPMDDPTPQEP